MKSIIFDLDLTLVDSTIAELARKERNWNLVYSLIPKFTLYNGIETVFEIIRKHHIKTVILSTSPKPYLEKVCAYFSIPYNFLLGYHDCKPIKPHPAGMIRALELLGRASNHVISFGDRRIDIEASNSANIESVACFWGTKEKHNLLSSEYSHAIIKPIEIITLIR